jgi:hypothetical protein
MFKISIWKYITSSSMNDEKEKKSFIEIAFVNLW